MIAMILRQPGRPLERAIVPDPEPTAYEILVRIAACAVCRTDLHVIDGELPHPKLPLIPGHEIVGRVVALGRETSRFGLGDRVGIPWLALTCGACRYCRAGMENLCDSPEFTGYTRDGGYAEMVSVDERFAVRLPDAYADAEAAPLLCAGLIGYRSLAKTGDASRIGIYGFGAAAHVITQVAVAQGREIYAFTRPDDLEGQSFARSLGASWVGSSTEPPPDELDAAIIFAPVGSLVPAALRAVRKGGIVVCGGIHMSDIPQFPYELLWGERTVCSVANLTRRDAQEFMGIVSGGLVRTHVETFPLSSANEAISRLRTGQLTGAAVLISPS
ncbi:MAG TPA: zinc-dependent alcohol dehydrogenase family protein [Terriglobia bacterium]|nr:zinc-dependent alcohol dehydrogenase family protein [Terriglobia bacterium]